MLKINFLFQNFNIKICFYSELKAGNENALKKGPDIWQDYCKMYETTKKPVGLESQ